MQQRLRELEELILSCRSGAAKELLIEAVNCYEVGAIRSAIVSTWTAVFFDILEKSRELGLSGDAAAQKIIDEFEKAESDGDISKLLKIEGEILERARRDIELFSVNESKDLIRIQEDRHRCAHPTLNGQGEKFVPAAELARTHIVNAATILLQYPPMQGKAALQSIVATVSSKHFPFETRKVVTALEKTGLKRPRAGLLRNSVVLFAKKALGLDGSTLRYKFVSALRGVVKLHQKDALHVLECEISKLLRNVRDEDLVDVLALLNGLPELCNFVEEDQKDRLDSFVKTLAGADLHYIEEALQISFLTKAAERRCSLLTIDEISKEVFCFILPKPIGDRLIALLEASMSYDKSNTICVEIRKHLPNFSAVQKNRILQLGETNGQVQGAFEYSNLCIEIEEQSPAIEESPS
ncbi:hypothetical protein [Aliiroseovarius crassostreae]|uniref:hypothetical protein n=1 Tax=Aliiroseovarius crassostreae TaxID=154981 RepID=UPI002200B9A5|nr:hypothetical protein [Aliiroseovarius crassostreae]UWQ07344.1 hypothetical protein K3X25_11270 [Aliiroseovarius crassostreae]